MLIENISGYGWKRAEIPALTVTGVTPCDFGNPALLYRFDGTGSVKISADEATLIYDGQLPYAPQEPIACDSLIFEAAGEEPVTVSFLGMLADVLTIPAEALVEQGNQTVVYTGYDEETQALLNPVIVTVGNTDGKNVEILDGLALGQTYYYAYYDTLEISVTPDFGGFGFR